MEFKLITNHIKKKFSDQFFKLSMLILLTRLWILLMLINTEMELPSLPVVEMLLVNSKEISKLGKLESIFLSQFHSQCSHSLETNNQCGEHTTSMERLEFNSSHNGKLSQPDGKKSPMMHTSFPQPCQP